jgi:hypothetical protein
MSEQTSNDNTTRAASQEDRKPGTYPARDSENGEEQKNRLGYMVTDPTEDEIEEGSKKGREGDQKTDGAPTAA